MKLILLAAAVLFGATVSAQNQDVALNSAPQNLIGSYASSSQDVLLGEFDVKSKKSQGMGKDACFFENNIGEGVVLKSFLFKVDKAKHTAKANIRLYEKKEFIQELYVESDTVTYPSFIPGNEIPAKDIVVTIAPGQEGVVEIDLSEYNITMPAEGLFVSLELIGYFDAEGNAMTGLNPKKDLTRIDFHPTTADNYCGWAKVQGREGGFWMNRNKWTKADFKYAFKKEPHKNILTAPNFGLKIGHQ